MRFFPFVFLLVFCACRQKKNIRAIIHTGAGDIRVRLFDDAPRHRDFFVTLVQSGAYDSLLVGRIERDFVVQSGFIHRPATPAEPAPEPGRPLLRGALAANGPTFFIVQGRPQTEESLNQWEKQSGEKIPPAHRELYKKYGGAPQLEGRYTVFGEVTGGFEVVDKIAALPRDAGDRPLQELRLWVRLDNSY